MQNKIGKLIIVRHAQSEWNKANLFTGKTDVHLTAEGFKISEEMGNLIKDISINRVFTSTLCRTIETEVCMMSGNGHCSAETINYSSALNERDYGDFTGISKKEEEIKLGEDGFTELRRSWDYPVPNGETLKMVYERAVPFFKAEILPILKSGENVLVVSHGNTLRAIMKYIENISDEGIEKMEMPFNQILIYDINTDGHILDKEIRKAGDSKYSPESSRVRSSTNIIATIGPSSAKIEVLDEMIKAGMDMARLNFFWSNPEDHGLRIKMIREVSKTNNIKILIIEDLPGPRIQEDENHTYEVNTSKSLTDKDREFIKFGVENGVDYISVSFVGSADDVLDCKNEIRKNGGKQKVIAKIERAVAIENIDEIIKATDAIMIARGDLANEVPIEKIPFIQNDIIKKCKVAGKPVITATQMLYTMKDNPYPTRAEATDVVTAVLEGSDAIMLSEETSSGKYPIRAVYVMEHLALEAETHLQDPKFNSF